MAMVFTNQGRRRIAQRAFGNGTFNYPSIILFNNNISPAVTDGLGSLTIQYYATGLWRTDIPDATYSLANPTVISIPDKTITFDNGYTGTVYGYAIVDWNDTTAYVIERFDTPKTISANGDSITIKNITINMA